MKQFYFKQFILAEVHGGMQKQLILNNSVQRNYTIYIYLTRR